MLASPGVLSAMHEARLFRMYVPIEYGGLETDPITSMQVVEAVAEADAAAAWNLMIGATYGIWAAFLPEASAREIYGATDAVVAGALRPSGTARLAAGGYRVSGRWGFASGIDHCAWWNGGCIVYDGEAPRLTEAGAPQSVLVFFPATDGERIGTAAGKRRSRSLSPRTMNPANYQVSGRVLLGLGPDRALHRL